MLLTITAPGTAHVILSTLLPPGLSLRNAARLAADLVTDTARRMGVSVMALGVAVGRVR